MNQNPNRLSYIFQLAWMITYGNVFAITLIRANTQVIFVSCSSLSPSSSFRMTLTIFSTNKNWLFGPKWTVADWHGVTFERSYSCTIQRVPHRVNFAFYWSRYNTDKTNWGHLSSKNGLFSFVCTSPNIHMHDLITPYGPKYDTEFMGSWVTFWFALLALRIYSIIINCAIPTDRYQTTTTPLHEWPLCLFKTLTWAAISCVPNRGDSIARCRTKCWTLSTKACLIYTNPEWLALEA